MCLLNRLALASRAEDNGCMSSLVTKIFIWKIIRKYMYWAKPGLGEYEGGSLLGTRYCRVLVLVGPYDCVAYQQVS